MRENKIDFNRIAFWAKQPVFGREITIYKDKDGNEMETYGELRDVHARAARLKRMHEEFGTMPEDALLAEKFQCESRRVLKEVYQSIAQN